MPHKNREKQLEAQRIHYKDNKSVYSKRFKLRREKRREYIQSLKLEIGCQVCGYKRCKSSLVFHHKNQIKDDHPKNWYADGWSYERIDKDLNNCLVLCANCHNEHHEGIINADSISTEILLESSVYKNWNKLDNFSKEELDKIQ